MKITEKLLKQVVTESLKRTLLKEFYSEKDFDPKQSRNRNWGGKVSWLLVLQRLSTIPPEKKLKLRSLN